MVEEEEIFPIQFSVQPWMSEDEGLHIDNWGTIHCLTILLRL
jgi:hypothetical protein